MAIFVYRALHFRLNVAYIFYGNYVLQTALICKRSCRTKNIPPAQLHDLHYAKNLENVLARVISRTASVKYAL